MTGLPYLAENIKSLLRWSVVAVASLFGLWLLWLTISFSYKLVFPPEPTPADVAFGKLRQPVDFNSTFTSNLFILDTPGDTIVSPPRLLTVYEIPTIEGEFVSLDSAKKVAKGAGLDSEPKQLSENEWHFTNKKNPSKSLKFNIVTHNFVFKYDWNTDSTALEGVFKTDDEKMIGKAKNALDNYEALKDDLESGSNRVSYWKIIGDTRSQVGSYSEANAVMVEFFRADVAENSKLVELKPSQAQVNVWFSAAETSEKQLLEINFTYYDYDTESTATYPPKSPSQAFEDLKNGQAYVAVGVNEPLESITITKTSLSYINPNTDQRTLQPVYVFEGTGLEKGEKKTFLAYVPAISSEYQR